jgi:hypothetical protein
VYILRGSAVSTGLSIQRNVNDSNQKLRCGQALLASGRSLEGLQGNNNAKKRGSKSVSDMVQSVGLLYVASIIS